jgi:hypothetical protein
VTRSNSAEGATAESCSGQLRSQGPATRKSGGQPVSTRVPSGTVAFCGQAINAPRNNPERSRLHAHCTPALSRASVALDALPIGASQIGVDSDAELRRAAVNPGSFQPVSIRVASQHQFVIFSTCSNLCHLQSESPSIRVDPCHLNPCIRYRLCESMGYQGRSHTGLGWVSECRIRKNNASDTRFAGESSSLQSSSGNDLRLRGLNSLDRRGDGIRSWISKSRTIWVQNTVGCPGNYTFFLKCFLENEIIKENLKFFGLDFLRK